MRGLDHLWDYTEIKTWDKVYVNADKHCECKLDIIDTLDEFERINFRIGHLIISKISGEDK